MSPSSSGLKNKSSNKPEHTSSLELKNKPSKKQAESKEMISELLLCNIGIIFQNTVLLLFLDSLPWSLGFNTTRYHEIPGIFLFFTFHPN
jgi:hypothetical protein